MNLKYLNITISGGVAVGKSTLINNLISYLSPYGWRFKSVGEIHREFLKDNVMPEASKVTDDFDRAIENKVEKILRTEKKWIIQAWLSGFIARNIPSSFRVLLICKNNSLRVDRVANRDNISVEEAKKFISKREVGNLKKYKRLYGNYNFWDPKYYHLIIDTYSSGQLETVGKVLDKLGFSSGKQ